MNSAVSGGMGVGAGDPAEESSINGSSQWSAGMGDLVSSKLLKVDSSIHFQTEPESSRIYGSGYFTIETSDFQEAPPGGSRIQDGDIILYKVRTTGPLVFCVKPTIGLLRSQQYVCIHVRPNSGYEETGGSKIGKYKFEVQALVVPAFHRFLTEHVCTDDSTGLEAFGDKDALHTLWNELSRSPGAYVERHKLVIQVHPVEADLQSRSSQSLRYSGWLGAEASSFQQMGIIIAVILLVWLGWKLMPMNMLRGDDAPAPEGHAHGSNHDGPLGVNARQSLA